MFVERVGARGSIDVVLGRLGLIGLLVVLVASCGPNLEPRLEASPSVGAAVPVTSPTQAPTKLASNVDARPDLYVVDPKSREATPLLSEQGSQSNAEVSPDGRQIVYENRAPGTSSQISLLEPDGTTRQLTNMKRGASDPTWSPDGSQIAFAGFRRRDGDRRPDSDIFVMNADGSHIRRLAGTPRPDGHPDWSPDGSQIVFHSRESGEGLPRAGGLLWLVSAGTRTLTRLLGSGSPFGAADPTWSPDGRWIAFSGVEATINGGLLSTSLWLMRSNGTHKSRIRKSAIYRVIENPSWSPDGRSIVFEENDRPAGGVRWEGTVGDVGILDVHGERLRWIVRDAPSDQPSWGPDGIVVGLSRASAVTPPDTIWEPSWGGQPDTTIVLTGTGCEQVGDARPLHPGVLTIEFVNESYREGIFKVVRVAHGRRLADLGAGPSIAGGWGERNAPSGTDIWSSPRGITSGRWAVVCFKDLAEHPRTWHVVSAGIVGPIEVG